MADEWMVMKYKDKEVGLARVARSSFEVTHSKNGWTDLLADGKATEEELRQAADLLGVDVTTLKNKQEVSTALSHATTEV